MLLTRDVRQLVHCTYLIGVRLRGVVTIEVQRLGASPMFRLTADITKVSHWTTGEVSELVSHSLTPLLLTDI